MRRVHYLLICLLLISSITLNLASVDITPESSPSSGEQNTDTTNTPETQKTPELPTKDGDTAVIIGDAAEKGIDATKRTIFDIGLDKDTTVIPLSVPGPIKLFFETLYNIEDRELTVDLLIILSCLSLMLYLFLVQLNFWNKFYQNLFAISTVAVIAYAGGFMLIVDLISGLFNDATRYSLKVIFLYFILPLFILFFCTRFFKDIFLGLKRSGKLEERERAGVRLGKYLKTFKSSPRINLNQ